MRLGTKLAGRMESINEAIDAFQRASGAFEEAANRAGKWINLPHDRPLELLPGACTCLSQ
jgi:hypothetical protein